MISDQDAMVAVGMLVGACPGPWTDDTVHVWHQAFTKLDDGRALRDVVERFTASWTSPWRPSLGLVIELYEDTTRHHRTRGLPSGVVQCDGAGWVATLDGYRPCRRCNPVIATVFDDADYLADWQTGGALHHIVPGVELVKGRLRWHGPQPPVCRPAAVGVLRLAADRGIAVARDAYVAECAAAGKKPKLEHFDRTIRAVTR